MFERDVISTNTEMWFLLIALQRWREYCVCCPPRVYHSIGSVHHIHAFGIYRGAPVQLCIIPNLYS